MSLYIAVITYILMILVMSCLRASYPLILLAFVSIFMSLSINSLFDSSGLMAVTTFTTVGGITYTQSDFMSLIYISLTIMIFAKIATTAWKRKNKNNMEE